MLLIRKKEVKKHDFSGEILYVSWSRVYAKEEADIESILDLQGKTVAVMAGSVNFEGPGGIKELARKFDVNCTFREVDSYHRVFELVESGEQKKWRQVRA
jgi:ABC-type amino acid transport substrate-binding protein